MRRVCYRLPPSPDTLFCAEISVGRMTEVGGVG